MSHSFLSLRRVAVAAIGATMIACDGDGGDGGGGTSGPAQGIQLSLTPAALSIQQSAQGTATLTLARTGGFTGAVSLAVEGLPAAVTATLVPASLTGAATSATLTLSVANTAVPGAFTATLRGTATGVSDATASLSITITPAPAIALALAPPQASVVQGGSGEGVLTINRTNFTGAVSLAASGVPAGATVAFQETPTALNQVRVTWTTTAATPVGVHAISLTGSGTGVASVTATLTLTVTPAISSQVEFQFCSASEDPVFFAWQDGSGAWTRVSASPSGGVYRYRFTMTQGRGGVYYVQQSGSFAQGGVAPLLGRRPSLARRAATLLHRTTPTMAMASLATDYETTVWYATSAELATIGLEQCAATQSGKSVLVPVAGVGSGQTASLSLGGATEEFDGATGSSPVRITDVRPGLVDFLGARSSALTGVPNKLLDVRNLNPPDESTLGFTADFNGANAYDPASAQLTIMPRFAEQLVSFTSLYTANGDAGLIGGQLVPSTATTRTWYGLPTARLRSGDLHEIWILGTPAQTTTAEGYFQVAWVTMVGNQSLELEPGLPLPVLSSIGTPAWRRLRLQGGLAPAGFGDPMPDYDDLLTVTFGPSSGGNEVSVAITSAFYVLAADGQSYTYDVAIPDLSAMSGFPLASGLPGGELEATVLGLGYWAGSGVSSPVPAAGRRVYGATRTLKLVVP